MKKDKDLILISKKKLKRTLQYGFDNREGLGAFHQRADTMYERIIKKAEKE